jgi:hypothetical protein
VHGLIITLIALFNPSFVQFSDATSPSAGMFLLQLILWQTRFLYRLG